ncbi:hypothetical protein ABIC12_001148 [Pantoea agglomerans]
MENPIFHSPVRKEGLRAWVTMPPLVKAVQSR